jgi:hypothetical protein
VPVPRERSPITFTTDRTGEWRTQRIADDGTAPSLALDGGGRTHVVFADRRGLRYVRQATDQAPLSAAEAIPPAAGHPGRASLGIDAEGRPAVAWVATVESSEGLLWSPPTASGWGERESIAPASVAALSFDRDGRPHLVYLTTDREDGEVVHGVLDGGAWSWTTLGASDLLESVALDASGTVATAAWAGGPEGAGGVWLREPADASPD